MNRPYVPELRSIPLTFMDCDLFPSHEYEDWRGVPFCMDDSVMETCSYARKIGTCPRGFQ